MSICQHTILSNHHATSPAGQTLAMKMMQILSRESTGAKSALHQQSARLERVNIHQEDDEPELQWWNTTNKKVELRRKEHTARMHPIWEAQHLETKNL